MACSSSSSKILFRQDSRIYNRVGFHTGPVYKKRKKEKKERKKSDKDMYT